MKKKIKIFLASSKELEDDRKSLEIFIGRKNKKLFDENVFLELVIWEDFIDAMSKTRLQDEYNKAIRECDIFLMLYFTKVGKYTAEEFENAFKAFKENNKPFIFTYFKDAPIFTGDLTEEMLSLINFKKKLKGLGHFTSTYKNSEDLAYKFGNQLEKLKDNGFIKFPEKEESTQPKIQINQTHSGSGDNVGGDKIINN